MEDLLDELEDDFEQEGEDGSKKKERVFKPAIIIDLTDTIRVVLTSDRKNLELQVKSEVTEKADKALNVDVDEATQEDSKWKFRAYYGTRNWQGVLERAYAIAKEEKLGKKAVNDTEDLREAIHSTTAEIKKWAKQIAETLIINKINL